MREGDLRHQQFLQAQKHLGYQPCRLMCSRRVPKKSVVLSVPMLVVTKKVVSAWGKLFRMLATYEQTHLRYLWLSQILNAAQAHTHPPDPCLQPSNIPAGGTMVKNCFKVACNLGGSTYNSRGGLGFPNVMEPYEETWTI